MSQAGRKRERGRRSLEGVKAGLCGGQLWCFNHGSLERGRLELTAVVVVESTAAEVHKARVNIGNGLVELCEVTGHGQVA
ncbi:hypothetical protein E2C01_036843 [Portunus trituberculatus]|uniref:Uncharacterized protein n=1 Tax=Portunus trituberculatus TaxID=210409 RepID=A0A5B7FDJ9_PORTR|nr:hypothetical protein [Portunus trituberculatus]